MGKQSSISRRRFIARGGCIFTAAMAAGALTTLQPLVASADEIGPLSDAARADARLNLCESVDQAEHDAPLVQHPSNGDEALYADKYATFTKCLPHDSFGRVDLSAYQSLINALTSGVPGDFENITLGGARRLDDPQSALAYDLEGTDSHNLTVPSAPEMAGAQTAAEMVEMYWASLLRDVALAHYNSNPIANAAASELNLLPGYAGPRNIAGQVTTNELFRGGFPGETDGPYISQFFVLPTYLGAQPISQKFLNFKRGTDYITGFDDYVTVQNGGSTGKTAKYSPVLRHIVNGRGLSCWVHSDVLYQAYFVALLDLAGMNAPLNPGNPYASSRTQAGFGTFGPPDFAATIGEVASRALKAVWFQKWSVHRRARPEAAGGIVHLIKSGQGSNTDVTMSNDVLNSQGLAASFNRYGSYLLSQTFPEGSPAHPSYPTGHGTVAGACIAVLKFFFDGSFEIPNPKTPNADGTALVPYRGAPLTVNGELNKLGHNVSFAHGIHSGIHYRSDTDESLRLGEAVGLSVLQDKAQMYNEKFTVNITKFDGTTATISNM